MKRSSRLRVLLTVAPLVLPSLARATDRPQLDAYAAAPSARGPVRVVTDRLARSVRVLSTDTQRGVPTMLLADPSAVPPPGATPDAAALGYLSLLADTYGLSPTVLSSAYVESIHDTGRGGIIVTIRQQLSGAEVFRSAAKVLMDRDLRLVAIGGNLHADVVPTRKYGRFELTDASAVAAALSDLHGVTVPSSHLFDGGPLPGGYRGYAISAKASTSPSGLAGVTLRRPARVKRVFYPMPQGLVPAYFLELSTSDLVDGSADAYAYVVAATDGRILHRSNLTHSDAFSYRVWADPTGDHRPADGPLADYTPHPTSMPDGGYPTGVAPSLITIDGFNTTHDPWLDAGATESNGNNVDAYTHNGNDGGFGTGDLRATTTSASTFDRVHDISLGAQASSSQKMASVTSLFYTTNWLHDWWYDSGFDEAGHNAQKSNYGRGGIEGDALFAQAQDGAPQQRDNSNMAVYDDGGSPEMHMFVWDGRAHAQLHVTPPGQDLAFSSATFGPGTYDVTGSAALVADGSASPSLGCQALTNAAAIAGKFAVAGRGTCSFKLKAKNAQNAGAIGLVVVNNASDEGPPPLGNDQNVTTTITIPVVGITLAQGTALETALQSGNVTVHASYSSAPDLDGTIDNTIVAHEWGHYLHLRNVSCASALCAAESEGWADFTAMQMVMRPGDDLHGTYALAQFATGSFPDDPAYFGIRRYPYSTDFTKSPLTFKHITSGQALPTTAPVAASTAQSNNAEAHAAGEIWGAMLFESFAAMLAKSEGASPSFTFDEARRRMSDYVVAGLKMAPADPTYTEQRDAILAAAAAADPADVATIAAAFARRGAGSCAVSPARDSTEFEGVVEDFTVSNDIALVSLSIDDSVMSCDGSGHLDAGEKGVVTVTLKSGSALLTAAATVMVQSTTPGISFPSGNTVAFSNIASFATVTSTLPIALDASVSGVQQVVLTATLTDALSCDAGGTLTTSKLANYDEIATGDKTDTVEASITSWAKSGTGAGTIWARLEPTPGNHVWAGSDAPHPSDTNLRSPVLQVSATDPLVLTFKHRFQFETSQGSFWDGGVVEVSVDGGSTWADASTYGTVPYGGEIGDQQGQANNVLQGRQGFVDHNASFPDSDDVTIDMGTSLAGKSIKVRFRIGTDDAVGAFGWELDDIAFSGIDNAPFSGIVDNADPCGSSGHAGTAGTGGTSGTSGTAGTSPGVGGDSGTAGTSSGSAGTSASGASGASGDDGSAGTAGTTSTGGSAGFSALDANQGLDTEGGGCGCRTTSTTSPSISSISSPLLVALGAMLAGARRRRRVVAP